MSTSGPEHSSLGQLAAPVMNRAPSGSAIPEEVLREVYGETEFSVEELMAATNNFGASNQIGVGGSGSVYWGELRGRLVAVKRLRWWGGGLAAAMTGDSNFHQFLTELRVMRRIHHPNLLELQGVCVCATELLLVFDYQHNGSLDRRLRRRLPPPRVNLLVTVLSLSAPRSECLSWSLFLCLGAAPMAGCFSCGWEPVSWSGASSGLARRQPWVSSVQGCHECLRLFCLGGCGALSLGMQRTPS